MGLEKYESYYVQIRELYLLLAGLDIPYIYGIASDKDAIPDREETNRILIRLYQKGFIDWEEDCIAVKQPYADILETILRSKNCVIIRRYREDAIFLCCYLAIDGVVVTEKSQREEETLCISYRTYAEWIQMLEEYLKEEIKYIENRNKLLLEIRDTGTGMHYANIKICEQGLQTLLVEIIDDREEQMLYEKEVLEQRLKRWSVEVER